MTLTSELPEPCHGRRWEKNKNPGCWDLTHPDVDIPIGELLEFQGDAGDTYWVGWVYPNPGTYESPIQVSKSPDVTDAAAGIEKWWADHTNRITATS